MHQFKIGDFASTSHLSDHSPVVVVKVSASGKSIVVCRVSFLLKEEHQGKCFGLDITEDMVEHIESLEADLEDGYDPESTYRLTTRKRGGAHFRGPGGTLTAGFLSYHDPSF